MDEIDAIVVQPVVNLVGRLTETTALKSAHCISFVGVKKRHTDKGSNELVYTVGHQSVRATLCLAQELVERKTTPKRERTLQ